MVEFFSVVVVVVVVVIVVVAVIANELNLTHSKQHRGTNINLERQKKTKQKTNVKKEPKAEKSR